MKYHTAIPIGSGGMGEVARAWDPELERWVALKYLRTADPELEARMVREARAQAKVDHPNVCRVYETGKEEGRAYIAMQLIEGETLDRVAPRLSLEQKLVLLRTVAEAVQAAHAAGLVHRDLKPSNVLVREEEDGSLTPFVVDFGIARTQEVHGATISGQILGTPGYLSPEQARGATQTLDRRSDVFSLGVILYELLTGEHPFEGEGTVETLLNVLERDPPSPRKLQRDLPRDLDTIVLRCLEKRPEKRYASARALAEDLGRYLDGLPIEARPVGPLARLGRRLLRHRRVAALLAGAGALALLFAGLALHASWSAGQRERAAQRFGQQIERVEALLRQARMAPPHDIAPSKQSARRLMRRVEEQAAMTGVARGPALFALGRGEQALGDVDAARTHLEAAWEDGYREPEVSWALGAVLAEVYRQEMEAAAAVADPELRVAAEARARETLLIPALDHLERSRGAEVVSPSYLEALLAFGQGRLEDATTAAQTALAELPWLQEAPLLAARSYLARARIQETVGRFAETETLLTRAEDSFRRAAEIAASDARAYLGRCEVARRRLALRIEGAGGDLEAPLSAGRQACQLAAEADSELAGPHRELAELYRLQGRGLMSAGGDPELAFDQAASAAQAALERDPEDAAAYLSLGRSLSDRGDFVERRGESPMPLYDEAAAALAEARRLRPESLDALYRLGVMHHLRGRYLTRHGGDPIAAFRAAEEAFQAVLALTPHSGAGGELAGVYMRWALTFDLLSEDARRLRARGIAAARRAVEVNPSAFQAWNYLGNLMGETVFEAQRTGDDTAAPLAQALESWRRALEIKPDFDYGWYSQGRVLTGHGAWLLRTGQDPTAVLERAIASLQRATEVNPEFSWSYSVMGAAHRHLAGWRERSGGDPVPVHRSAIELYRRSLAINPNSHWALQGIAQASLEIARRNYQAGEAFEQEVETARRNWTRLLAVDPGLGHLQLGRLQAFLALVATERGEDSLPAIVRAREHFEAALVDRPEDPVALGVLATVERLDARRLEAGGQPTREAVERGREALRRAISSDPRRAFVHHELAVLEHEEAERRRRRGEPEGKVLETGLAAALRAVELDERQVGYRLTAARILSDRALWLERRGDDGHGDRQAALDQLESALRVQPQNQEVTSLREELEASLADRPLAAQPGKGT